MKKTNSESGSRDDSFEQAQTETRRKVLGSGAGLAAAAALGGLITLACGDDDDPMPSGQPGGTGGGGSGGRGGSAGTGGGTGGTGGSTGGTGGSTGGSAGTGGMAGTAGTGGMPDAGADADIVPLNALLSAEYTAVAAYTAGAGLIMNAPMTDPLYALRQVIVDVAVSIQSQHKLHAKALVDAIVGLKGTPVVESEVAMKFKAPPELVANPSITNVLKFAAGAERGAAVAYNQVLAGLESAQLRFLASSIEGDETQHFIVIAALVLGLAAPGPMLSSTTANKVVPTAFVYTVGTDKGLNEMPPDYFA
jgi:hypothetical protein